MTDSRRLTGPRHSDAAEFWMGMADALPLQVREIEIDDPLVTIFGDGWSLSLACPWDLRTPRELVDWEDPRLEDRVWDLIGRWLRGVERADGGDPRFDFDDGYRIDVHADTDTDPWVLRAPHCVYVGPEPPVPG